MSDSESPCGSPSPKSSKRCNKPLMEKRRRERINVSLNALKVLVLDALKKDTSQYSKLEKADILEMTVKHLRTVQRQRLVSAASTDCSVVGKYRAGFTECAAEVTRYLGTVDGLSLGVHNRLLQHLSSCMQRVASPEPRQGSPQQQPAVRPHPVSIPATQPIQIQIPMATSAASLPGAGIQALQMAAAPPASDSRGTSPPQHTSATYSPVGAPAYIAGAFQVIPGGQTAFMVPSSVGNPVGLVSTATPIYTVNATSLQQHQMQQFITHTSVNPQTPQRVNTPPSPVVSSVVKRPVESHPIDIKPVVKAVKRPAESHHCDSSSAVKRMMSGYPGQIQNHSRSVKIGISDTLHEEKVWRPW